MVTTPDSPAKPWDAEEYATYEDAMQQAWLAMLRLTGCVECAARQMIAEVRELAEIRADLIEDAAGELGPTDKSGVVGCCGRCSAVAFPSITSPLRRRQVASPVVYSAASDATA